MPVLSEEETKKFKEYCDNHPLTAKPPSFNVSMSKTNVWDILEQYSNQKQIAQKGGQ